jgi:hypothetical protein
MIAIVYFIPIQNLTIISLLDGLQIRHVRFLDLHENAEARLLAQI